MKRHRKVKQLIRLLLTIVLSSGTALAADHVLLENKTISAGESETYFGLDSITARNFIIESGGEATFRVGPGGEINMEDGFDAKLGCKFETEISTASFAYWDGGGADNNWSTSVNWGGDTVPSATDIVYFGSNSDKSCSLDGNVTVAGLIIQPGYDGTIAFNDKTITITGMLISLVDIYGAEKNFWLDLKAQGLAQGEDGRLTEQQILDYYNNLTPDQLLLMGKQICQDKEATDSDGGGLGFWIFGIMQVRLQKMDNKIDALRLFSIIKDKAECATWRWFIIQWIHEVGFELFSEEEQNQFINIMKNLIKDKTDTPNVRWLSVAHLGILNYENYKRALKADKKDILPALAEQIRENALTLLDILQDSTDNSRVIERAIRELGEYGKLNTPVLPKVKEGLLQAFKNRKKYSPECQEALVKVIMLDIGDTSILPEVYKMRDEIDDRSWKGNIGHLILRAEEAGKLKQE